MKTAFDLPAQRLCSLGAGEIESRIDSDIAPF